MTRDKRDEKAAAAQPQPPAETKSGLPSGAAVREIVFAVGLGLLIFFRPWIDGITFPDANFTFLWGYVLLVVLLASRLLFAREPVRFAVPTGILTAFVLTAFALSAFTVQKDTTYRSLLILTGHLLLFFVAVNGIRSNRGVAIVLGFFVVSSFAETLWSYLHITYVMPATRQQIAEDPSTLTQFFGATEMTADIKSRLESNRATGSLLFANALACWVLTGIPVAIGAAVSAFLRLRGALRMPAPSQAKEASALKPGDVSTNTLVAVASAVIMFLACYFYFVFYLGFAFPHDGIMSHPIRAALYCLAAPLAVGAWAGVVCRRHGLAVWLLYVQYAGMALFALLQVFGLMLTYSRGGMLATLAGLALLGWLVTGARLPLRNAVRTSAKAAIVLLCIGALFVCFVLTVAPVPAVAQQAPVTTSPQGSQLPASTLDVKGENPSRAQFMNPATAFLRFSYWGSGLRMAADNFVTGVGLGNFGTVYPLYQYLGAGDVQQAHNDFLQTLCETGIAGFALFTGFWVYFFVWGVRRIRTVANTSDRWMLSGLFAGVVAFVLHSVVDFNFSNPSLTALVFLLAGLFYVRASRPDEGAVSKRLSPLVGVVVLLIGGLVAGLGYQATMPERLLGDEMTCKSRLEGAKFICERARSMAGKSTQPVAMPDRMASLLFPDQTDRESLGKLYERTNPTGNQMRPLAPGELPPPNSYLIFNNIGVTRTKTLERLPLLVERIKEADGSWPYDPQMASHIWLWYDLLYNETSDSKDKLKYADACLEWARECVRRSPKQVPYSNLLGRSLWRRGSVETSVNQLRYYDQGLEEFKHTLDLYPEGPLVYFEYASRLREYGEQLEKAGDHKRGQTLLSEAVSVQQKAEEMQAEANRRIAERNAG